MEISALIIDDEPLAQQVVEQYAKKIDNLRITGKCNDALEARQKLQEAPVDLIFLDINMPALSGISLLRTLPHPPLVIFTTAYEEYALQSYELNAIDYLKKPFSFERFLKAFQKAEELLRLKREPAPTGSSPGTPDHIFIKSNKKTFRISFADILYIEGLGDYIKIHLKNQHLVANLTMKKMEELLPSDTFYRIHKSFIISLPQVESIEGNLVTINRKQLPVGNNYRQEFFHLIESRTAE